MSVERRRVMWVDHVSKVLGGAEVNLVELLLTNEARSLWESIVACAPGAPLSLALARNPGASQVAHGFDPALNELRVVGRSFSPRAKWKGLREMRAASGRLRQTIQQVQPMSVVSCTNKDHFVAGAALRGTGIRPIWWVNDLLTSDFFSWPVRKMFVLQALRYRPLLVPVSRAGAAALRAEGIPASWIHPIHNGIDPDRYRRMEGGTLRIDSGELPKDQPWIGVIGRWTPWKGQDVFLRVAEAWIRAGRPGRFLLVGGAFNEDVPYANTLQEWVRDRGLGDRIHFVPFQADIVSILSQLDVVLHTSTKPEPFGRVLVEAMAVGVPVIATRAGGVPEIVTSDVNGLTVEPGDVDGFVAGLQRIFDQPERGRQWIEAGKAAVREQFHVARVVADFNKLMHPSPSGERP